MSFLRYALPALAVAGSVFADDCSNKGTSTIKSSGDATGVAGCKTFKGSVAIATDVPELSLDGKLEEIDGDLLIEENDKMVRFSAGNLKTVTGKLSVSGVPELAALTMPALEEVDSLTLLNLANLRELGFTKGISKCDTLRIENTRLSSLNGINLEEAADINIANNGEIDNISFMNMTNITSKLTLSYNNAQVNVSFPKLEAANNISMRAIGSLDIPALSEINSGSFGIFESNLTSVSAPNLTKIDGALVVYNNPLLKNVSFDALETVGADLRIANNTKLNEMEGLPKLKNVQGALDISGNFSKVATPDLEYVKGVFNLQSESDIGDVCEKFYDPLKDKKKLPKGDYVCEGDLDKAQTAGNGVSGSKGGDDDEGAAVGLTIPSISLSLVGLFAVLLL